MPPKSKRPKMAEPVFAPNAPAHEVDQLPLIGDSCCAVKSCCDSSSIQIDTCGETNMRHGETACSKDRQTQSRHDDGDRDHKDSCCAGATQELPQAPKSNCEDTCCDTGQQEQTGPLEPTRPLTDDVEKGLGSELVAMTVFGMTCTGCGDKLKRALCGFDGVSEVKVNFVMGNAEFSMDPNRDANHIIKDTEKATGFRCSRLDGDLQTIDILASGAQARSIQRSTIDGLRQVTILNKQTVRLSFDPTVIGSRTLTDGVGPSGGLAPFVDPAISSGQKVLLDKFVKMIMAAVLTIPVAVLAYKEDATDPRTKAIVSLALGTCVQLIAVPEFYLPAIRALVLLRQVEMDLLVVISITAAYLYSVVAFAFRMVGRPLETSEFFETSTLLITLVLMGRVLASYARMRAVAAVSFRSLEATSAIIVEHDRERGVDARLLQYGDSFRVLPHAIIPTDGLVVHGSSEVDESMLTGESEPVHKMEGSSVVAGTMNGSGALVAQLTRLPGKNTVTDIAQLVEQASASKPKIQELADKVAGWFVPAVSLIAFLVTIIWVVVGLEGRNHSAGRSIATAITYAVATLAVSCPCALGLAVPMVLVIAGGIAARNGVIIKSAESTERSHKVTDVVCDKTGTVTESELEVVDLSLLGADEALTLAVCKAAVADSNHPVSLAVSKKLASRPGSSIRLEGLHAHPGFGIEAAYNNSIVRAGNAQWTDSASHPSASACLEAGHSILVVTLDSDPIAVFGLRPRLRPEATFVLDKLRLRGITVHLVSGDHSGAVNSVAAEARIINVAARCTPSEKRDYVSKLMAEGKTVLFVGDGTNDAVAVTQADIGVQMGGSISSSDVTRGAADVVLLGGLEGLLFLLDISRVSYHRMMFNFAWSAVYNIVAILFASGAFVRVRIPPAYAGLGEIVSILPVVLSAMTMLLTRLRRTT